MTAAQLIRRVCHRRWTSFGGHPYWKSTDKRDCEWSADLELKNFYLSLFSVFPSSFLFSLLFFLFTFLFLPLFYSLFLTFFLSPLSLPLSVNLTVCFLLFLSHYPSQLVFVSFSCFLFFALPLSTFLCNFFVSVSDRLSYIYS